MNWYEVDRVREIATSSGWKEIDHQENIGMVSFSRNGHERINVYYTKGTVGTCLNHPKQGKTQLFRRNVGIDLLTRLFEKPRLHTRLGYKRRR